MNWRKSQTTFFCIVNLEIVAVAEKISALESYNYCGMPFEPEEEIAEKILNFLIGEEKENECT